MPARAIGRDADTQSRGVAIGSENRPQGVTIASDFTGQSYDSARAGPITPSKHTHASQDAAAMNASRGGSAASASSRKRQTVKPGVGGEAWRARHGQREDVMPARLQARLDGLEVAAKAKPVEGDQRGDAEPHEGGRGELPRRSAAAAAEPVSPTDAMDTPRH